MKNWNWFDVYMAVGVLILFTALAFLGIYIHAPKQVDYYYTSHPNVGQGTSAICVYAHWTWHSDEIAYCTDDAGRALQFMNQANLALKAAGR